MRKIIGIIAKFLHRISQNLKKTFQKFTYHISRATIGALAIGGALCGINVISKEIHANRLMVAGMAFIVGMPLGIVIFGASFSLSVWFAIVSSVLLISNLHSTWNLSNSLFNGGLEYIMNEHIVTAVEGVTPTTRDWKRLNERIKKVQKNIDMNALNFKNLYDEERALYD